MLERIHYLADQGVNFAFETTLASRTFITFLEKCKAKGYEINILFLWLRTPDIAVRRVKSRVEQGGHDIPEDIILRRYHRSIKNFQIGYTKIATNWMLYDNSEKHSELIAYKISGSAIDVVDQQTWQLINGGLQYANN